MQGEASTRLGFTDYFRVELAWAKLLGAVLLLAPVPARLKEWAYAAFAITLGSALIAHLSIGEGRGDCHEAVSRTASHLASRLLRFPNPGDGYALTLRADSRGVLRLGRRSPDLATSSAIMAGRAWSIPARKDHLNN
jgi:DoxX-like family